VFPRQPLERPRSACDLGWFERKHQIGTTGQTVSPKLYIACGISGAFQMSQHEGGTDHRSHQHR